jgi:hypothetical protein
MVRFPVPGGTVCPLDKTAISRYDYIMMNEVPTVKKTISNLSSGEVVKAGYIRRGIDNCDPNRFVGFKVDHTFFSDLKLLKKHFGVRNLKELEFEVDRLQLGSITAEFFDVDEKFFWGAYLWSGSFRVGSSADRLVLQNVA